MKKNIFAQLVLLVVFVGLACVTCGVGAQLDVPTATPVGQPTAQLQNNLNALTVINNLTNWFFALFLIVAVWFLILAAFHFVTANGETEKVNTARNEVLYAMIGVIIAVLAKGLVSLAMGLAEGK